MGMFFNRQLGSLEDLLLLELNDLYDGEKRLCDAIPKMAEAASSPTPQAGVSSTTFSRRGDRYPGWNRFSSISESLLAGKPATR